MTDYAKLTKAQLIEKIRWQESALMSQGHDINASLMHEFEMRQIELEIQNQELRHAQQQLETSRDLYSDKYHFSPAGYLLLDKNGLVLEINLAGAAMLGADIAGIVGKPFNSFLFPDFGDAFYHHLRKVFGHAGSDITELQIKVAGDSRDIHLESAIEKSESGKHTTCRMTITDITQCKKAEKNLAEREEQLSLIGKTIAEVFWMVNAKTGQIITVSQSYERVWRRPCKKLYISPQFFFDTIHPDDRTQARDYILREMSRQLPFELEFRIMLPDGAVRWILDRGYPVRDQTISRYVGVAQDITALREAEHRAHEMLLQNRKLTKDLYARKDEERSNLARELHDDLGQSLTAIQAEAGAILGYSKTELPAEIIAGAHAIRDSAAEMHKLIRNILSRLRPVLLQALGLADALQELVAQWQKHNPHIHCELKLEGKLVGLGEAIDMAVYRTLQEALTNVIKHAQAGQVVIHLQRLSDSASAADSLLLTVEDDGRGMAPDSAHYGLGLLGMRERAIALGGEFEHHSNLGQGLHITVRLPLEVRQEKKNRYLIPS